MAIRRPPKRSAPPIDLTGMVRLIYWPRHMDAHGYQVGIIGGTVADDVLVRFGEVVVQVPPEMVELTEQKS